MKRIYRNGVIFELGIENKQQMKMCL